MNKPQHLLLIFCFLAVGCAMAAPKGYIGASSCRRFVLLGENKNEAMAQYYADKYNAPVLRSSEKGMIAGGVTKALTATLGPSRAMRNLMNEFISMSNTSKHWEVIVPKVAERYFLVTLRNMGNNTVTHASGTILLPESSGNAQVEKEVARVFGKTFEVVY